MEKYFLKYHFDLPISYKQLQSNIEYIGNMETIKYDDFIELL